ncbi:MAG: SnoaL-like domain-containing protein [Cyanobacteria bacterium CRU_2_1]|nr:SnoaL-like domain-containing protein [Cyanobacteria bacterium RU_5_0]NJR62419.1 SnoaL-like domain-containing protein [Cyanobacteria bacterium CRU_2_1]
MTPAVIEAIVKAYYENFQAMNPQGWTETFTEDAIVVDPVGTPPNNARENAQKFLGILAMIFTKMELSQDQVFIAGNGAAVKWTMRVTGKNGKQGIAEGISVFEVHESGKIQKVSSYWDEAALKAQMKD